MEFLILYIINISCSTLKHKIPFGLVGVALSSQRRGLRFDSHFCENFGCSEKLFSGLIYILKAPLTETKRPSGLMVIAVGKGQEVVCSTPPGRKFWSNFCSWQVWGRLAVSGSGPDMVQSGPVLFLIQGFGPNGQLKKKGNSVSRTAGLSDSALTWISNWTSAQIRF